MKESERGKREKQKVLLQQQNVLDLSQVFKNKEWLSIQIFYKIRKMATVFFKKSLLKRGINKRVLKISIMIQNLSLGC